MKHRFFLLSGLFLAQALSAVAQEQTPQDTLSMDKVMHSLPEVMVKGSRPIVKTERGMLSYNMPLLLKQLPADNAYEALTRIPGVSDADGGGIKFSGNEVTLILNGQATTLTQEQLVERLKALPADRLAKAEVMLAASARYHVRGMAINIVTADYAGTNHLSGQIEGGWQQSKYGEGFGKGYLSLQHGKFGLDTQYSFIDGHSYGETTTTANHPLADRRVPYSEYCWQKPFFINHGYRLGMDYAFAKNHRLGVAYTGKWDKNINNNHTSGSSISEIHYGSHAYLHNVDLEYSLPFGLSLSGSYTYYRTPQQQKIDGTLYAGDDPSDAEDRNLSSHSQQTIKKMDVHRRPEPHLEARLGTVLWRQGAVYRQQQLPDHG